MTLDTRAHGLYKLCILIIGLNGYNFSGAMTRTIVRRSFKPCGSSGSDFMCVTYTLVSLADIE